MKKKSLVLPIAVILISVVFSSLMIFYTTDYAFIKSVSNKKITGDIKAVPILEKAYEIDPSCTKLERLKIIYGFQQICHAPEEDMWYFDSKEIPDDFMEKSVKYSKLYYEYTVNPESVLKRKTLHSYGYAISVFGNDLEKNNALVQYATSVYLNGQREEAKELVEDWLSKTENEYVGVMYQFVLAVHRVEKDEEWQKWMVDIEERATQRIKEINENLETDNTYLTNTDGYVPFDWQVNGK